MKKYILILAAASLFSVDANAQKYFTRNGHVWFFSTTPVEDIEAHNHQANSVIDYAKGDIAFTILMKSFEFEKALMQEHFNEKYVESDEFPKASFKGKINNMDDIDFTKDGTYEAKVSGDMTIHGKTNPVETTGSFVVKSGKIQGTAKFQLTIEDYDIKIPGMVKDKIAKVIDINVDMAYEEYKK